MILPSDTRSGSIPKRWQAPAIVDAEGEHLVRDQQGAALPRLRPDRRHEISPRRDQPERGGQRIHDDCRQVVPVLVDQRAADLDVVERQGDDFRLQALRHARFERRRRPFGLAPVLRPRAVGSLRVVVDAVVAALELRDLAAARRRARGADRQQHALAAGVREPDLIDVGGCAPPAAPRAGCRSRSAARTPSRCRSPGRPPPSRRGASARGSATCSC